MDFLFGGSSASGVPTKKRKAKKAPQSASPVPIGYLLENTAKSDSVAISGNIHPSLHTNKYIREASLSLLHVPELYPYNKLSYILMFGATSKIKLDRCMIASSKIDETSAGKAYVISVMESKGSRFYVNIKFTDDELFQKWLGLLQESITELVFIYAFELERSNGKCIWEQFPTNLDDSCSSPSTKCDCCFKLSARKMIYALDQCAKMGDDFNCELLETTKQLVALKKSVRGLLTTLYLEPLDPHHIKQAKSLLAHAEEDKYVDIIVKDCDVQLLRNYVSYSDNRVSPMKPGHSSMMHVVSPVRNNIDMITTVKINDDFDKENDNMSAALWDAATTTPVVGRQGKENSSSNIIRNTLSRLSPGKRVSLSSPVKSPRKETSSVEVISKYHFTRTPVSKRSIKKTPMLLQPPLSPDSNTAAAMTIGSTQGRAVALDSPLTSYGLMHTPPGLCLSTGRELKRHMHQQSSPSHSHSITDTRAPSLPACATVTQTSCSNLASAPGGSSSIIHIDVGKDTVRIQDGNNNVIICNVAHGAERGVVEAKVQDSAGAAVTTSYESSVATRTVALAVFVAVLIVAAFIGRGNRLVTASHSHAVAAADAYSPATGDGLFAWTGGVINSNPSLKGLLALFLISRADMMDLVEGQMCI